MKWVRLYTEIINDRKLRRLPAEQRWLFVAVMCIARRSPKPGYLLLSDGVPVMEGDLVDEAAVTPKAVKDGMKSFIDQNMVHIEGGVYVVTNWDKRQHASDDVTARTRKYKNKNPNNGNVEEDEKERSPERSGNVTGTPPDTETESEYRISSNTVLGGNTAEAPLAPHEIAAAACQKSEYVQALTFFLQNRIDICGYGSMQESDIDRQQAKAWLGEGIPLQAILDGITQTLKNFKPKYDGDRVNSLRYCDGAVRELHGTRAAADKLKAARKAEEERILAEMAASRKRDEEYFHSIGKLAPHEQQSKSEEVTNCG